MSLEGSVIRFGRFELDLASYQFRRAGKPVKLDRIPFEVLRLLAESPGKVVTHEEAVGRVWGEDVFIEAEAALYTAISKIRRALNDDPARPRYLETVSRRGYRFVAPIERSAKPVARA